MPNLYKKAMQEILTCIPAYEPPPCDCCYQPAPNEPHVVDCKCGIPAARARAERWCERMDLADKFERLLARNPAIAEMVNGA